MPVISTTGMRQAGIGLPARVQSVRLQSETKMSCMAFSALHWNASRRLVCRSNNNVSGSYPQFPPGGLCDSTPCEHNISMSLTLQNHTAKTLSLTTLYTNPVNATVQDVYSPVETLTCIEAGLCLPAEFASNAFCPVMGSIFAENGTWSVRYEFAHTRLITTNVATCTTSILGTKCIQPVTSWCSNTPTPDLNPPSVITAPPQWNATFDDGAICFRIEHGVVPISGGWKCSPGIAIRNPTVLTGLCTLYPTYP